MRRFILAEEAVQDLEDIWEYIAEDSFEAADRFINKLHDHIRKIAQNPGIGHTRTDLAEDRPNPVLRRWELFDSLSCD
jgi:plasmid stabilization system protein ParE